MPTVNVSTTAQLEAALSVATAGEVISLAAGSYNNVTLNSLKFASNITLQSASSTNKAVITALDVKNSSGVNFSNLNFSAQGAGVRAAAANNVWPFTVTGSNNISFDKINMYGDTNATLATQASGLEIHDSKNCAVTNSTFQYLSNAVSDINDNGLNISSNSFSHIITDSIHGGGTSNVVINNNTFTDQFYLPNDPYHPDCIQFWTTNTTQSASNITITNNTYTRGTGGLVHGIFLKDEVGNLPFQNVVISGNKITGGGWDGIYVMDARNLTVSANTVNAYSDAVSKIWITDATGSVTNNTAGKFVFDGSPHLIASRNTVAGPTPIPLAAAMNPATFVQTMAAMTSGGAVQVGMVTSAHGYQPVSLAVVH